MGINMMLDKGKAGVQALCGDQDACDNNMESVWCRETRTCALQPCIAIHARGNLII